MTVIVIRTPSDFPVTRPLFVPAVLLPLLSYCASVQDFIDALNASDVFCGTNESARLMHEDRARLVPTDCNERQVGCRGTLQLS